jgi:UDP-sulfoquinovose synthase
VENPRVELEDHYYNAKHTALVDLGLKPTLLSMTLIDHLFDVVERHKDRVDLAAIMPTVSWRETTSELPQTSTRALAQT